MKHRLLIVLALGAWPMAMMADEYSDEVVPSSGNTVEAVHRGGGVYDLTAVPAYGWTFAEWSDTHSSTATRTATVTGTSLSLDAKFEDHRCTLYGPKYPAPVGGGGTVSADAGSCECEWQLTATPASGWAFKEWSDGNADNPRTVTVNPEEDEVSYTATFVPACVVNTPVIASVTGLGSSSVTAVCAGGCDWTLTVAPASGYTFMGWSDDASAPATRTVTSDADGADTYTPLFERTCVVNKPVVPSSIYYTATVVETTPCTWTVTLTPASGYTFLGWDEDNDGEPDGNTDLEIEVTSDDSAPVTYTPIVAQTCVVNKPLIAAATGMSASSVLATGNDCEWRLSVTAASGYTFIRWSDDDTSNPRTVTSDASGTDTYTPVFVLTCSLNAPVVPSSPYYTVTVSPGLTPCTWVISLTPEEGYEFIEWSDGDGSNPRTVTSDDSGPVTYTPTVEDHRCSVYPPLIASVTGMTASSVTPTANECEWEISVTADEANCYRFVEWSDHNTDNPRTVTSTNGQGASITYTPVMVQTTCLYEPAYTASEGGTVSARMTNECDCEWQLAATPASGWTFAGWDEDGDGTADGNTDNPLTVNLSGTEIFYAVFEDHRCTAYEAKVTNPAEGGTVTAVNGACECDWTLTATPTEGYAFLQWDDCYYLNPRTVTVDPDAGTRSYTAHFLVSDAYIDGWTETEIIVATEKQNLTPTDATIRINGVEIDPGHTLQDPNPVTGEPGTWTLPGALNDYAGQPMSIIFYDDVTGLPVSVINSTVPYVSTGTTDLSNITPSLPEGTDIEIIDGKMTFDENGAVLGALTVYPDAKAVIPAAIHVTFTHIYMRGDGLHKSYPQLVANGSITNLNNDTIYYDYTLDYAEYYPLALPYAVACSHIRTKSGKAASYEVQWYNGEDRAANSSGWTVFDDQAPGATLQPGAGYIVFAVPYKWKGVTPSVRHATVAVRFPMVAGLTTPETEKSVPVYLYGGDYTNASNRNWNFIGNPYLAEFVTKNDNLLMTGSFDPAVSTPEIDRYDCVDDLIRYITTTDDGFRTYRQQNVNNDIRIKAFNPFFIQAAADGTLVFDISRRTKNAPRRLSSTGRAKEIAFGVTLASANATDQAGLLYGETFTDEYEMNADLVKLSGSTPVLELYSLAGNEKRVFNALALSSILHPVPLGFTNAPIGELTIAMDSTYAMSPALDAVMLTDYETGRVVNLLNEPYRFTTDRTTNDTRLAIHAVLAPRTTTDIESVSGGNAADPSPVDGVYDLLGRRVVRESLPQGVYIIVEDGKSRKEVIR